VIGQSETHDVTDQSFMVVILSIITKSRILDLNWIKNHKKNSIVVVVKFTFKIQ